MIVCVQFCYSSDRKILIRQHALVRNVVPAGSPESYCRSSFTETFRTHSRSHTKSPDTYLMSNENTKGAISPRKYGRTKLYITKKKNRELSTAMTAQLELYVLSWGLYPRRVLLYLTEKGLLSSPLLKITEVTDRKSTRLNSSHSGESRMPSSA